ncbi:MAG: ABC transporter ATP-binding protein [Bacillota bacterium]
MGNSLIEITDLTRTFNRGKLTANDHICLSVAEGEVLGLLGPNGAGKTTLISQIAGILQPTGGDIVLNGTSIVAHPQSARGLIGYMAQFPFAAWHLTAREAIVSTARLRGLGLPKARLECDEVLADLEISDSANKLIGRLSGGTLRMAMFAIALVGKPKIVILDEPTEGVDNARRKVIWRRIRETSSKRGSTIILVTHNVSEAEVAVDRVGVMSKGKMIALGSPTQLRRDVGSRVRVEVSVKPGQDSAETEGIGATLKQFGQVVESQDNRLACEIESDHLLGLMRSLYDSMTSLSGISVNEPTLEEIIERIGGLTVEN